MLAGETLRTPEEIGNLLVTTRDGRPVYVRDVADVGFATDAGSQLVSTVAPGENREPAVTLAVAKRAGSNAVTVADAILHRVEELKGSLIPADIRVEVTRNYGETANEKANELLYHLGLATVSIIGLVVIAIGWREGVVVAVVIPVTILLTLFASWLMGYTLNRVSLFALIFSIGILVDDAIVVIENIARHWAMPGRTDRRRAAIEAVAEVGNPTIIATLTVVAALLPMLFVSGMMGPYMSPIPANASAAMIFSFFVAVTVTPWLMLRVAGRAPVKHDDAPRERRLPRPRLFRGRPPAPKTKARSWLFLAAVTRAHPRLALALLHQARHGEAAALRQQVGAAGGDRPARGLLGRGDRRRRPGGGAQGDAASRGPLGAGPCRHRRALQLQRPRAPRLPALEPRDGRRRDQPRAEGRARPRRATPSRSTSASG